MPNKKRKFKQYYCQYKDKIYTYFYYRVNFNQATAEDLCSEVFVKALKAFSSFDQDRSFQAWVYMIARNHLINHYRLAGREVDLEMALNIAEIPWEKINVGLECEQVLRAITRLKSYYRDVLLLKWVDGLSNKEIAKLLNKDEGAVRTQVSRAREALREAYQIYD